MKQLLLSTFWLVLLPSLGNSQSLFARQSLLTGTHLNQVRVAPTTAPHAKTAQDYQSVVGTNVDESKSGFSILVGYKLIDIDDYLFRHSTHPDDSFLQRAAQPGSAGTTVLKNTNWALFGAGYLQKISASVLTFDVGLLVGIAPALRPGHSDSRKKNENDSRPDAQGAFIYSKPTYGLHGAVGFAYDVKRVSLGVEGQVSVVKLESGWDRFSDDEKEATATQTIPTIGPKFGVLLHAQTRLEGIVQIGRSVHFGVTLRHTF